MLIRPGAQAVAFFSVSLSGENITVGERAADVRRNGIVTTLPVTISELAPGDYQCAFAVPDDWSQFDQVHVGFTHTYLGATILCVKQVGVISEASDGDAVTTNVTRILNLLESDEVFDKASGKARKLLRGTDTVLLEKDVTGSTLKDSVSIVE